MQNKKGTRMTKKQKQKAKSRPVKPARPKAKKIPVPKPKEIEEEEILPKDDFKLDDDGLGEEEENYVY